MDSDIRQALTALQREMLNGFSTLNRELRQEIALVRHEVREVRGINLQIRSQLERHAILLGPVATGVGWLEERMGDMTSMFIRQKTDELERWTKMNERVGRIERHLGFAEPAND